MVDYSAKSVFAPKRTLEIRIRQVRFMRRKQS